MTLFSFCDVYQPIHVRWEGVDVAPIVEQAQINEFMTYEGLPVASISGSYIGTFTVYLNNSNRSVVNMAVFQYEDSYEIACHEKGALRVYKLPFEGIQ